MSLITLVAAMSLMAEPLPPGETIRKLSVDGCDRWYLVHVPKSCNRAKPTPLVLVLHGGGSNPTQMVEFSGMSDKAEQAGFIAVYPAGSGRVERFLTFNAGNCCGYAQRQGFDDVKFVGAVLDDLASIANVDTKRVYATGMSNGAVLAYLLADKLSERIAAIAPVAGPMGADMCTPKQPVSVIHFHGTLDANAPLAGGKGKGLSGTKFYSVQHSIDRWVVANSCHAEPREEPLADVKNDGMKATRKTYGGGKDGSEVVLVTIEGGGHTWPGRPAKFEFLGPTTLDISANDLMWDFFQKHPRK